MAPRKEKAEKSSSDDNAALILQYLKKQNRPYSANDVSTNLHNKVTKAQATKVLKDLHERKEVGGKAAGKQIIYHTLQAAEAEITPDELAELDHEITSLREEAASVKNSEKLLKLELAVLGPIASLEELQQAKVHAEKEKQYLQARIATFDKREVISVSKSEEEAINEAHKFWQKQVDTRKKIGKELWYKCSEVLPEGMTMSHFWESLGLEGQL